MQIMINNSNNKAPPVLAGSLAIPSQHCKFVITHAERAPGAPWWCCEGWSWHTAWHRKRGCCDPRCSTRRPGAKAQGQALLLHRGLAPQADGSFFLAWQLVEAGPSATKTCCCSFRQAQPSSVYSASSSRTPQKGADGCRELLITRLLSVACHLLQSHLTEHANGHTGTH